jgi:diacylglycerol O-acyltransferase
VTSSHLLSGALRLALARRAFNLVLTNIPGPPVPLYLLGCRLQRLVPIVNLWPRQSIGIAVASYHGRLTWGIQADRDDVPDLDGLVQQIPRAFRQLRDHLGSTGAEVIPLRAPATF